MARFAIRPVRLYGLGATPGERAPEGASETYLKGAVLVSDGSGRLQEGSANPTSIVGVADEPGANNSTEGAATTHHTPALPHVVFEGSIDDNTDLGNGAIAAGDLFTEYGITEDSDGIWYVDKGKTGANARVRIVAFKDDAGTTQGRVYFVFTYDATIYAAS